MIGKISIFITSLRIWLNKDIDIRIYSGTVDKWHNIVVTSLMWHMTCLGLYHSPDSTIQAVQKSPNACFDDCPPVRPLHSSKLCCLDLCCVRVNPQGRDGRTAYPSVVLASFPQFGSTHNESNSLMNLPEFGDRFCVICNTFIRTSYT